MGYAHSQHCLNNLADCQAIDYFLARQLTPLCDPKENPQLFHLVIALSQHMRMGSSCLAVTSLANKHFWQDEHHSGFTFADSTELDNLLNQLPIRAEDNSPLVYQFGLLYLRRYWQFEVEVAANLRQRLANPLDDFLPSQATRQVLTRLFPALTDNEPDFQAVAVANALHHRFYVLSGGPGTGKTYTLCKLLLALTQCRRNTPAIRLAAPTGKAAQRMLESIGQNMPAIAEQAGVPPLPPLTATTLHRLLGIGRDPVRPRYHQDNKIEADVVVIDEASMLDLAMFSRLLRALPDDCQLILLGDAQQLPSVAIGQLLLDICPLPHRGYSDKVATHICQQLDMPGWLETLTNNDEPLDHVTVLTKTRRQTASDSPYTIKALAEMVISNQAKQSWQWLSHCLQTDFPATSSPAQVDCFTQADNDAIIKQFCQQYYVPIQTLDTVEQAFNQLNQFRVLTATRIGEQGSQAWNQQIQQWITGEQQQEWYKGRPIMVTENDYNTGLFNGDIGLVWPTAQGNLLAYFVTSEGLRSVALSRLPAIETVYAMTIHKTQGSEFTHVAMILTEQSSITSPQLLYTGMTRAKSQLSLFTSEQAWSESFNTNQPRCSGLAKRLTLAP